MNWDKLSEEYCHQQGCSIVQLTAAQGLEAVEFNKLQQRRTDINKAALAVKAAYEKDPTASRKTMRREAYKFIGIGFLFGILLQVVVGMFMRKAIEWFLDRIFN